MHTAPEGERQRERYWLKTTVTVANAKCKMATESQKRIYYYIFILDLNDYFNITEDLLYNIT